MIPKPCIVASLALEAIKDTKKTAEADMIEVRLDLVNGDPMKVLRAVRRATQLPIIATNRMLSEGGRFRGEERERLDLLSKATAFADYIDIELRAALRDEFLREINKPMIVSYHDFRGMPAKEELKAILEEMKSIGATIAKMAVTPCSLKDNLELLAFLLKADMPLCVIALGELGRHLRVIAPIYGSVLTYGYVSKPTAPGQMSISELKKALELMDPATSTT